MSLYPQFNLFWVRTQGTMTNFVIVYCLPEGSQAQVLHGRRGAAVGILSGPYSILYLCCICVVWSLFYVVSF